ncbi:MAG TPA: YARHG domain-containing protein [Pyrinomonadaceae bacterium]|nr:YARHG domain-containing protein [Pyrinomonadaceae bacterium]
MKPRYFLPLALIALFCVAVNAQDALDAFKELDFSRNSLKQSQIQRLSLDELKMLRGIVFGRHGRVFKDADIKSYLDEQSWYKPNPDFKTRCSTTLSVAIST